MKKSIIYISSLLLASCAHASLPPPQSHTYTLRQSKLWTGTQDAIIIEWVEEHGPTNWDALARQLPGKTARQVRERWCHTLNPALVKGSWTREEDAIIIEWVRQNGTKNWSGVAELLTGRIGKQCKERWLNRLDPAVNRDDWTPEEDARLTQLQRLWGNHWQKIALVMGRGENQVKNRWYATLSKRLALLPLSMSVETPPARLSAPPPFAPQSFVPQLFAPQPAPPSHTPPPSISTMTLPTYEPLAQFLTHIPLTPLPTYGSQEPWLPPLLKGPCNPTE